MAKDRYKHPPDVRVAQSPALTDDGIAWNSTESTPRLAEGSAMLWTRAPSKANSAKVFSKTSILWLWKFEILAAVGLLGLLAAMIAILRLYGDRPLNEWPFAVSINASISFLAAAMKVLTIFIVASGKCTHSVDSV